MRLWLYLCLTIAAPGLATCSDPASPPQPKSTPAGSFTHDPISGETRARIAPNSGSVATLRSGLRVPVRLPPGFTLYPGATVVSNTAVEREGRRYVLVAFETPDPIAEVMLFHRAQAQAAAVELTLDLDGAEAAGIAGRTLSGGDFALTARRAADRTILQLSAG